MLARSARALLVSRRHLPALETQTRGLLVRKGPKRPAEESSALVKAGDAWVAVKDKETGARAPAQAHTAERALLSTHVPLAFQA